MQTRCKTRIVLRAAWLVSGLIACGQSDVNLGLRGDARVPGDIVNEDREVVDAGPGASEDSSTSGGRLDASDNGLAMDTSTDATIDDAAVGEDAGSAPQESSGCGREPPTMDTSIPVDGMTGSFLVELPAAYDKTKRYPLLLTFRGANMTAEMFRSYLSLPQAVASEAIVVHLDCLSDASSWDVTRDLPFVDALLGHLGASYCIDEQRMFAIGHAAGAAFVNLLGCLRGDVLRAIAALSVGPSAANGPTAAGACSGMPAVWLIQGVQDLALGAARFNRDQWLRRNQCQSRSSASDPFPCVEYAGCEAGAALRYCEYDGGVELPDFASSGAWSFFRSL